MLYFILGMIFTLAMLIVVSSLAPFRCLFPQVNSYIPVIQAIGSLAIFASASVALSLYRATTQRHMKEDAFKSSEVFLTEAKALMDRTYEVFTSNRGDLTLPNNSRVLWLTVARMIVRYKNIKKCIKDDSHIDIINENEEYWRFKFYDLLNTSANEFNSKYFSSPDGEFSSEIDTKSIAVIFEFSDWKGPDLLKKVDEIEIFAKNSYIHNQFGLHGYLTGIGCWDKVLKLQERNNKQQGIE